MNSSILTTPPRVLIFALAITTAITISLFAASENPATPQHQAIQGPARVTPINATITPLFWRAEIGPIEDRSIVNLPLRSIEYFGVQHYQVDAATIVRELTVGTSSNSLIRIYHIRPLGTLGENTEKLADRIQTRIQDQTGENLEIPIKSYPDTTHRNMVEYRVHSEEEIFTLHTSLEQAMIEYHSRDLVAEQREQTVRRVVVSRSESL